MTTPDARIEALERELAESGPLPCLQRQREYHEGTRVTEHRYEDRIDEVMRELAAALEENERLRLMLPVVGATVMPPGAHERLVAELADARALLVRWDSRYPREYEGEDTLTPDTVAFLVQPPSVCGGAGPTPAAAPETAPAPVAPVVVREPQAVPMKGDVWYDKRADG